MLDPNEDTEWNDILRSKGILPPKEPEITEESLVNMVEQAIENKLNNEKQMSDMDLDELDELEDSEDEAVLQEYRNKRIAEMKALAERSRFGVAGTIIYFFLMNIIGRKLSIWSIAVPHAISWILIEYGIYPWQLYLSRVLGGLGSGGTFCAVPIFIAEISESRIRGSLGSLLMLSANAGFLIAFIAGYYLTYHTIPYIGFVLSVVFFLGFTYFPETPSYLDYKTK